MTPLLQYLSNLLVTTSPVKIEQRKEAQKIQEVRYVTETVLPTEEVWEHEELVGEHAEVFYEEVTPLGKKIVLFSEVDVLSSTERDKKSELRSEISVTDSSQMKETRLIKHREKEREVKTLEDKPSKEKSEGEFFVRTIESPAQEIKDERKDSTSVRRLPDKKDVSEQVTSVTIIKEREITEREGRQVRDKEVTKTVEYTRVKETDLDKEIQPVTDADKTKPFPVSTEARKQTEKLEMERKALTEVTYEESVDHDFEIIPAIQEEKYSRTEKFTEITIKPREIAVKEKPTEAIPSQVKRVDEEMSRKEETQVKPVVKEPKKDETSPQEKVSLKKHEVAEKKQDKKLISDDIIDTKKSDISQKPKPKAEVTTKESVTDIELKRPKVIQQERDFESVTAKTEEESKYIPLQRDDTEKTKEEKSILMKDTVPTKPSVPSKPEEQRRISPQTAPKGTKIISNT